MNADESTELVRPNSRNIDDHDIDSDIEESTFSESSNELFDGSTHAFVVYYNKYDTNSTLLGYFVIVIQYILYSIIITHSIKQSLTMSVPVEIKLVQCQQYNGLNLPLSLLTCDPELDSDPWWLMVMAMILTAVFLQKDYLLCIRIWCFEGNYIKTCGQFAALLIFVEAVFATVLCSLMAYNALYLPNGSNEAIMVTIGVLFVHDIDEKLFEAHMVMMEMDKNKCHCCYGFFKKYTTWIFLLIIVTVSSYILPYFLWDPIYYIYNPE